MAATAIIPRMVPTGKISVPIVTRMSTAGGCLVTIWAVNAQNGSMSCNIVYGLYGITEEERKIIEAGDDFKAEFR